MWRNVLQRYKGSRPKRLALLQARRDYPDQLEADFQQFYGLDIYSTKSAKAARLMLQLPKESRLMRIMAPENEWGWNELLTNKTNHLLEVLLWSKTEGATKRPPVGYPEPFVPPFIHRPPKVPDAESHDLDDIKSILSKPRGDVKVSSNEQES